LFSPGGARAPSAPPGYAFCLTYYYCSSSVNFKVFLHMPYYLTAARCYWYFCR